MELPEIVYEQVENLSSEGNDLFDDEKYEAALLKWTQALDLLPEPRSDWDAYTWLTTSIGDAHYHLDDFEAAKQFLFNALNQSVGQGNPFVHYRLGQCEARLENKQDAINHLLKAYMLDGQDVFMAEPDGINYLLTLKEAKLIS
jgi:tetratricopeptide (TPR) repeat protein